MRILLPPSETKAPGGRGRPLVARTDTGPLADPRAAVLRALHALTIGDPATAARALLLPAGVAQEALAANRAVCDSPTTAALRRYTGVVYEGLGFGALGPAAQRVAARSIVISSGLFGAVRGDEPVPLYRVPAKAALPGLGIVATFWRRALRVAMPPLLGRGLVLDLRSGDYRAMWQPATAGPYRVLTVRVLSPTGAGGHAVLSYPSKFAKGRLTAALVTRAAAGDAVDSVDDVMAAWQSCEGAGRADARSQHLDLYTR